MRWNILLSMFFFLLIMEQAEAQELPLTHFTSDSEVDPLPSALVAQVYQDKLGFIWLANYSSGLVRHDGVKMDRYDEDDGLRDLGVWQVQEDGRGYLWVTSDSGLVVSEEPLSAYQKGKRIHFTSKFNKIPLINDAVSHNQEMAVGRDGNIYVGTASNGIISYFIDEQAQLQADTLSTSFGGSKNSEVISVAKSSSGKIIAGLEGGKLALVSKFSTEVFYAPEQETETENFGAIYEDEAGKIWAYNQSGTLFMFKSLKEAPRVIYTGTPSTISSITAISGGRIYASNGESGIWRIDANTGKLLGSYSRKNGLLSSNVYHVLQDREKNIWIAQSGGLSKLRYNFRAFENYTANTIAGEKPFLSSGRVNSVFLPKDSIIPGRFWLGTEGGVNVANSAGEIQFITQKDGLAIDWVNGISADDHGRLWFGTVRGLNGIAFDRDQLPEGVYDVQPIKIFNRTATLFKVDSVGIAAVEKFNIEKDSSSKTVESIWFTGVDYLFGLVENQIFHLGIQHGLPLNVYNAVTYDADGYMWVGTREKGLFRSTEKVTVSLLQKLESSNAVPLFEPVWTIETGAPRNKITKLLFRNGKIWVGTQVGLYALDPKSFEVLDVINMDDGLLQPNASSFALSPTTGNLWIGTNEGLAEVDLDKSEVLKTVTRHDGLISDEVWLYGSVGVGEEGEVYFGNSDGLSIYYPEKDSPNEIPPRLYLTSSDISYKSDSRNEVALEYVGLSFANVPEVRYRTRLLNYENKWSAPTTEKKLRYTNLPAYFWPKDYTLEVMARNGSGVYTPKPLRYTFSVKPVWWLQWWTFLLYLLLLTATIFLVDKMQRRRLIKKERNRSKLREAQLQAETATARSNAAEAEAKALKAENEKKEVELQKVKELEEAYEELKTAQNQVVQAEKMASLGRLATGIAHEIKNPLNFINNFAELSAELVDELEEMRRNGNEEEVNAIMKDLKQNTMKIEEHGKRADAIVRSMMQHARGGRSSFEELEVNSLVDKYSTLAYHGKKAQNDAFFARLHKKLSPDLGMVKVMGQEIGQVLLNIIGNSLDAVWEKKQKLGDQFEPEVEIITRQNGDDVEVVISDNGPGIPVEIREKIFEPFFTTKPTGEGTGLGLSLSYNIVTQGHNGSLSLIDNQLEGAAFLISLPAIKRKKEPEVAAKEKS